MPSSSRISLIIFAVALAAFAFDASSQSAYPNKPIRIVVPFPPGGSSDFLARGLGKRLAEVWRQQVVIDNRAGAGGVIGTDIVAKAAPDGYTLLMNGTGHAANPSLYSKLPYDTLRDFTSITSVADVPIILAVRAQLSVSSAAELIALARAKPGQLNHAAGGVGASSHLAGELFRSMAKIEWQTVQYKGGGPLLIDLLGGQVDLTFSPIASSIQHVKAGRLKALGTTSSKRIALMPDLPTIAESGLPGYESSAWFGIVAPAGVSKDIVLKVNREIGIQLQNPEFRDALMAQGVVPMGGSMEQFSEFIRQEVKKYATVIKESGIRAE